MRWFLVFDKKKSALFFRKKCAGARSGLPTQGWLLTAGMGWETVFGFRLFLN